MSDGPKSYASNVSPMLGRTATLGDLLDQARSLARTGAIDDARKSAAALISLPLSHADEATRKLVALAAALDARLLLVQGKRDEAQSRVQAAMSDLERLCKAGSDLVAEDHRDIGIALFIAGDHDPAARGQLEQAAAMDPQDASTWQALAVTLRRLELFAEAAEAFRRSLALDDTNVDVAEAFVECSERAGASDADRASAYMALANAYYASKRLKEAADACGRAVALHAATNTYLGYGTILAALDDYAGAIDKFDHAIALDADNFDARARKGEVLRLTGKLDEAVSVLKTVPAHAGEPYKFALGSLAAAYASLKRYDEARIAVDAALGIDPQYYFGLLTRANVLQGDGHMDDAIAAYGQVLAVYPGSTEARFLLAEALRVKGAAEESLRLIEVVLAAEPGHLLALGTKAADLIALNRPNDALAVLDEALKSAPNYAFGVEQQADAYIALKAHDQAIKPLEHLLELQPERGAKRFELAEQLRLAGRYDESLKQLDQLLKADPDNAMALGTKGQVFAAMGQREDAVKLLERALTIEPSFTWAHEALGEVLRELNRYADALAAFDAGLALNPKSARMLGLKGDVLLSLGRYDDAIVALDLAIGQAPDDPFALATKGQVLAAQEHRPEAVDLLRKGIEQAKARAARGGSFTLTWAMFDLAENLRVLNRPDEALRAYDDLLAIQKDRVDALGGKGAVLFTQDKYDEALALLDRSLALLPTYVFGQTMKSALLASAGELEQSAELGRKVTAAADADNYSLLVYGFVLRGLGRYAEAEPILLRAIEKDASDLTSRGNLGDVYRGSGRAEEAKRAYHELITRAGDATDPDTEANVGWAWYGLAEYDRAVQLLSDAVARGQKMAHAQFDLGLALLCSGRGELAQGEYERGLDMTRTQHHPWRQRGLLRLALVDIETARRDRVAQADAAHADAVMSRLKAQLDSTPGVSATPAPAP